MTEAAAGQFVDIACVRCGQEVSQSEKEHAFGDAEAARSRRRRHRRRAPTGGRKSASLPSCRGASRTRSWSSVSPENGTDVTVGSENTAQFSLQGIPAAAFPFWAGLNPEGICCLHKEFYRRSENGMDGWFGVDWRGIGARSCKHGTGGLRAGGCSVGIRCNSEGHNL